MSLHGIRNRPSRRAPADIGRAGAGPVLLLLLLFLVLVFPLNSAGASRPSFTGVAGAPGSGVACGYGLLAFASSNYAAWFTAAGVDSSLLYHAIVRASSRYLAAADDGSIWLSDDSQGSSFHRSAQPGSAPLRALCVVGSRVLAAGDGGQLLLSGDLQGGSWTPQTSPVTTPLRGAAWNGLNTVVVGDGGVILRGGADGTGWEKIIVDEARTLYAVTTEPPPGSPGQYLAVGEGGALWKGEPDGRTWVALTSPTSQTLSAATRVGPATVMVGEDGAIFYSGGGFENWSPGGTTSLVFLRGVAFTGSLVLAVGDARTILYSLIGLEWQGATVPVEALTWGALKRRFAHSGP